MNHSVLHNLFDAASNVYKQFRANLQWTDVDA